MTIDDWFTWAKADAERRGLPGLGPLLDGLRNATRDLRATNWDEALSAGDVRVTPMPRPASGAAAPDARDGRPSAS
jgi:hypothetical protein